VFAWLAPILRDRGVDGGTAGLMSVSIVLQMLGSFLAPGLAARFKDQRVINAVVALMTGGGFALSIFGPTELIRVWTGLLGLGSTGSLMVGQFGVFSPESCGGRFSIRSLLGILRY